MREVAREIPFRVSESDVELLGSGLSRVSHSRVLNTEVMLFCAHISDTIPQYLSLNAGLPWRLSW